MCRIQWGPNCEAHALENEINVLNERNGRLDESVFWLSVSGEQ